MNYLLINNIKLIIIYKFFFIDLSHYKNKLNPVSETNFHS